MDIKKVLVPVDFSPPSRLALDHGVVIARKFGARLLLLNVVEAFWSVMYTLPDEIARIEDSHRNQAWRMLTATMTPEDRNEVDHRILIRAGDIQNEIMDTIREQAIDMVVMGTHGRGLVARTLIGSVTRSILRNSPAPILTVCCVSRMLSFDRILFATDFSETCDQAFRFTVELARSLSSNLCIVHAINGSDPLHEGAKLKLDEMTELGAGQQINVTTLIRDGDPAEAIFQAAEDTRSDMIAIGVRKKPALERVLFGAIAERIIRESRLPVLSIPTI
jgi:nucleotide-binding universal stress UspA family protein